MTDKCPNCCVRLTHDVWRKPPDVRRGAGPWNVHYSLWTATCPNCARAIRSLFKDQEVKPTLWLARQEWLGASGCRKLNGFRLRGRTRLGMVPLNVLWYWHPLMDDKKWLNRMEEKLPSCLSPSRATVMVVPDSVPSRDVVWPAGLVDEVWHISSDIMAGASGPYPSVRAEMTLKAMFTHLRLDRIFHFWPAAYLDQRDYVPLDTDAEITKAWVLHQRANIEIQVNKDKS